jgi:hypothetical protein
MTPPLPHDAREMSYVFYNLFSRKKKRAAAAPAAVEETTVAAPLPDAEPLQAPTATAVPVPVPVPVPADSHNDEASETAVVDVETPATETVNAPAEEAAATKPRPSKATSPRTSTAKVAPPKATPATRPGSKPAAKPVAGVAAPQKPSPNRVNKPTKQGLLDAMAAEPTETPAAVVAPVPLTEAPVAANVPPDVQAVIPALAATNLAILTVPQLRARAKELRLVGYSRLPKAELLRVITAKLIADETAGDTTQSPDA